MRVVVALNLIFEVANEGEAEDQVEELLGPLRAESRFEFDVIDVFPEGQG